MSRDDEEHPGVDTAADPPSLPITPETYRLRRSIGFLLKGNAKLAMALAEDAFAGEGDLGFVHFMVLMLLREGVARTPGDLGALIGITSGAMTRLVDHLERKGLVARERSRRDRRSVGIGLTGSGAKAADALLPRLVGLWNGVLADFEPGEYRLLVLLLEKLFRALQASQKPGREVFPRSASI